MKDGDSGFLYKVKSTEIFVSSRPKKMDQRGAEGYEPDAYLSVTDTFCTPPDGKPYVWFPWVESRYPIPEMFYACNRALIWWVHYHKLSKVQVFCDGGTHRSVTVFGAFLLTYFPNTASEIVADRKPVNLEEKNWEESDPLFYIQGYLDVFPEDRLLFKVMGEDYLCRLDAHYDAINRRIKQRYGERNERSY